MASKAVLRVALVSPAAFLFAEGIRQQIRVNEETAAVQKAAPFTEQLRILSENMNGRKFHIFSQRHYDVVLCGSGIGAASFAAGLEGSGLKVIILEKGDLPIVQYYWGNKSDLPKIGSYKSHCENKDLHWGQSVGGLAEYFGAALERFDASDFERTEMKEGFSPEWPFSYGDMADYYTAAEQLLHVRGREHLNALVSNLSEHLEKNRVKTRFLRTGFHDSRIPSASYDGYLCHNGSKATPINSLLPILDPEYFVLLIRAEVKRFIFEESGTGKEVHRISAVEVTASNGESFLFKGNTFVLGCGALSSPVILLQSLDDSTNVTNLSDED